MSLLCPFCFQDKGDAARCGHCGHLEGKPQSDALPLRHGLQAGRYVVGCVLGRRGGFGIAYRAWDRQNGAIVVVKECTLWCSQRVSRANDGVTLQVAPDFQDAYRKWLRRFREEAEWIRRFSANPHVVRVSDIFDENNTAYYVMPFVDGTDLEEYCRAVGGRLPQAQVLEIARQLLQGLCELHAGGLVHRDIKPSNIIITRNRRKPVLIDFGAARDHFDETISRSHMSMHSPHYSPVEQMHGTAQQGPWTDIYALSATLYRCLVGTAPPDAQERLIRHSKGRDCFVPLHVAVPKVDSRLAMLVDNGLALKHTHRPVHASDALRLLQGDGDVTGVPHGDGKNGPDTAIQSPLAVLRGPGGLLPAVLVLALGLALDPASQSPTGWPVVAALALACGWGLLRWSRPRGDTPTLSGTTTGTAAAESGAGADAVRVELFDGGRRVAACGIAPNASLVIGRSNSKAGLCVSNGLVSAVHVRVAVDAHGGVEVTDLQSRNGTYVRAARPRSGADAWREIKEPVSGTELSLMLGPPDEGGVLLEVRAAARVH